MAYQDSETGIQTGAPREIYRFLGTYNNYFLTSYYKNLIVGGQNYTAVSIDRNALKVGTQEESQLALEVTMPFTHPLVREYAYDQAPPSLVCEIYRAHETDLDDTLLLWKGRVTSFTVEGQIAKLLVPAIFGYIMAGSAPTPRYQAPCNHILYDTRCGVLESGNKHTTTVSGILNNIITVGSNPYLFADLAAGMVRRVSSGESRMITGVTASDITLTYPFSNISLGDSVEILRGCDHSFTTCKTKFSNGPRYGGTPLVPARNPFTSKI